MQFEDFFLQDIVILHESQPLTDKLTSYYSGLI